MFAALTGLVAGFIHVWSGPDHLAAIAPLSVRRPRRGWLPGARWGLGHSAGVAVIGLLSLWLRNLIPWNQERISAWGERLVGVMLIAIGAWALRKAFKVHAHEHEHDGERHLHMHAHHGHVPHHRAEAHSHHTHAAFGIGLLHGLAGSSHFFGVLVALGLPTIAQSMEYLVAFGIGTVASMALFSSVMGLLSNTFAVGSTKIYRALMTACAVAAFGVGGFWLVS